MQPQSLLAFNKAEVDTALAPGYQVFRLDTTRLASDRLYLIFHEMYQENTLVRDALKEVCATKGDELIEESRSFKGQQYTAVSFPKKYRDSCIQIAAKLHLSLTQISQGAVQPLLHSVTIIPSHPDILVIRRK